MSNQVQQLTKVITGRVRLSFCNLFKARASQPGQDPKFSTTILLPKSDVATKQRIDAAIMAAIQQGITDKWNGVRPPVLGIPVYDGDGVRPSDGMPFGEECRGHWVFTASSKQQPEVVDVNLNPILNQTEVYSGIYARASVNFFPYSQAGKKGVGCDLNNVQKLEDGEPLSGRASATDDFGGGAAPAYPQRQPAYQQQPAYGPQGTPAGRQAYQPTYPPQPQFQQPAYAPMPTQQQTMMQPVQPQQQYQPQYPQTPQQQIDPITGRPVIGSVMGISG